MSDTSPNSPVLPPEDNADSTQSVTALQILKLLLKPIKIDIKCMNDLNNQQIDRCDFLSPSVKTYYLAQVPLLKQKYNSSKLSCLHKNAIQKQRFPQINLLRQILKCNGYRLKPCVVSLGYCRATGKKKAKRTYIITPVSEGGENSE